MISDFNLKKMSIVDFEILLLSNIEKIKKVNNGRITRRIINKVLGIAPDDKESIELVRRKLQKTKCIKARGRYYTFMVDGIIKPDDKMIRSDPVFNNMNELLVDDFGFNRKIDPVAPKTLKKKCKYCKHWAREGKSCSKKEGYFIGALDACTDGSFLFNPLSIMSKKKRGW